MPSMHDEASSSFSVAPPMRKKGIRFTVWERPYLRKPGRFSFQSYWQIRRRSANATGQRPRSVEYERMLRKLAKSSGATPLGKPVGYLTFAITTLE